MWALSNSHLSFDGFDELGGIVSDPIFENGFDVFDVVDVFRRIALDNDEIGLLAGSDRADVVEFSQILRAVGRSDMDCFDRSESRFDEQFDFALIPETGENTTHACRIEAGK